MQLLEFNVQISHSVLELAKQQNTGLFLVPNYFFNNLRYVPRKVALWCRMIFRSGQKLREEQSELENFSVALYYVSFRPEIWIAPVYLKEIPSRLEPTQDNT